jgi:hypothetical protein
VRAWFEKSFEIVRAALCGISRSPKSRTNAIVPTTSGMPASANEK